MTLGIIERGHVSSSVFLLLVSLSIVALLLTLDGADGATIIVPDDYETISEAVEAASEGDTVRVFDGIYNETVYLNKTIDLVGNGTEATVISNTGGILDIQGDDISVSGFKLLGGGSTLFIRFKDAEGCTIKDLDLISVNGWLSSSGIVMTESDENRIIDCYIDGFIFGLWIFSGSDDNYVRNVTFSSSQYGVSITGEHMKQPVGSTFDNCTFADNGIGLSAGSSGVNTSFYNCTFYGNRAGLSYDGGKYAIFIDCTFRDNTWIGMSIDRKADWARIERCTFTNNSGFGIALHLVGNVTIKDVTCMDNGGGIYLGTAYDTSISGGKFVGNDKGIWLQKGAANNRIGGVECTNNSEDGIYINRSHSNSVRDSTFDGNGNGITILGGSNNIQVTDCTIKGSGEYGLGISASLSISVSGCYLSNNVEVGIQVTNGSKSITIQGCSLISNGDSWHAERDSGIYFEDITQSAIRNVYCYNNYKGIWLVRSSNNKILDSNLTRNDAGISLYGGSDDNLIEGLTCIDNFWDAIGIAYSDRNTVLDCSVIGGGQNGIDLYSHSNDTIIKGCQVLGPVLNCLFIFSSSSVWVLDSTMEGSEEESGIFINGHNSDIRIERCSIGRNNHSGIRVSFDPRSDASDVAIVDNHIFNNSQFGLILLNFNRSSVQGNRIHDNGGPGILVLRSDVVLIANNTILRNPVGVTLEVSISVVFQHNELENNSIMGLNLVYYRGRSDYWLHNNSFIGNGHGKESGAAISYWGTNCGHTLVENNTLEGNNGGITVATDWSWRHGNVVRWNTIINGTGVALGGSSNDTDNHFYFNFLINNTAYGRSPGSTDAFDDGAWGNYWDDYRERYPKARRWGPFWLTPYEVETGSGVYDNYPLAFTWDPKPLTIELEPDLVLTVHKEAPIWVRSNTTSSEITRYAWEIEHPEGYTETKDPGTFMVTLIFGTLGSSTVRVTVYDVYGNVATAMMNVTIVDDVSPEARAGRDIHASIGEWFTLDGSDSGDNHRMGNMTWVVDPAGLSLTHDGPIFTLSLYSPGYYQAVLTVYDSVGNMDSDSIRIRVYDDTPPTADAGTDFHIGQNEMVTFNGSGSSDDLGVIAWNWSMEYDGSTVVLEGPEPTFIFETVGTYVITLKVFDPSGNWGVDNVSVSVSDTTPPFVIVDDMILTDMGEMFTIDASHSRDNIGIALYEWSLFDEGHLKRFHGEKLIYNYDEPGPYLIILNVTDVAGNWATHEITVQVRDSQAPMAIISLEGPAEVDVPFSLNGTASRDNIGIFVSYWTFQHADQHVNISGLDTTFTFEDPGDYEVTLTVRDSNGNQDVETVIVRVNPHEPTVEGDGPWSMLLVLITSVSCIVAALYFYRNR